MTYFIMGLLTIPSIMIGMSIYTRIKEYIIEKIEDIRNEALKKAKEDIYNLRLEVFNKELEIIRLKSTKCPFCHLTIIESEHIQKVMR